MWGMAKTRAPEAVRPSAFAFDPQDYPPHKLSEDEAAAVGGRLGDVDADYAPDGSDQQAQAAPSPDPANPEGTVAPVFDPEADPESSEEAVEALEEAEAEEAEIAEEVEAEAEEDDEEADEAESPDELTVAELKAELDGAGVEYDKYARKDELVAQVAEARRKG
jgi:hypothetical protein